MENSLLQIILCLFYENNKICFFHYKDIVETYIICNGLI